MLTDFNFIIDDLEDLNDKAEDTMLNNLREELNSSGMLIPNYKDSGLKGEFNDNLWVFHIDLTKSYTIFDFNKLEQFKFIGLKDIDVLRIKTYLAYLLLEQNNEPLTVRKHYTDILKLYTYTDFLNNEHLNYLNQLVIDELRKSETTPPFSIHAHNFLDFLIRKLHIDDPNIFEFRNYLSKSNENVKVKYQSRKLPTSEDIIAFHHCLETFFNDDNIDKNIKLLYKPIHIWWKLTNIIPMRPSEFCIKLDRNCIIKKDKQYLIKIKRIKDKNSNRFPILKEIEISHSLAIDILQYIKDTDKFGHTETLFSFRALSSLRSICRDLGLNTNNFSSNKIDPNFFSRAVFNNLLKHFYSTVIDGIYKSNSYERMINPGDTRHFAFFSLLMQGVSPVEIALLGGHSTLEMQVNYQNCIEYYIGTELYDFLYGKKDETQQKVYKSLNAVINSLPKTCPKPLEQRLPLKIGYCLCDFSKDECEKVGDFCCFCSKWWGEPTRITYDKWKLEINNEINNINKDNFYKISALEELVSINYIHRTYGSTAEGYIETKTTINALKNNCSRLIGLKTSLIVDDYTKQINTRKELAKND